MGMIRRRLAGMANDGDSPWIMLLPENKRETIINNWKHVSRAWYYDSGVEISEGDRIDDQYVGTEVKIGIEWIKSQNMSLETVFQDCPIVEVSPSLFSPIIEEIRNLRAAFAAYQRIGLMRSIPGEIFQGLTQVNSFSSCFSGQGMLTGSTPLVDGQKLWRRFPDASKTHCFSGCTGLDDYDSIPASWT